MNRRVTLTIASTWDGQPVPAAEQARVLLRLVPRALLVAVDAPFHGDPAPAAPPGPAAALWEHEVVELFVAGPGPDRSVSYTELELAPGGQHLVLQLRGVRRPLRELLPLRFRRCRAGARWRGAARLDRRLLPPPPWRGNAFAVHGLGAARRYLAATPLPGEGPDFHQPSRYPSLALEGAR